MGLVVATLIISSRQLPIEDLHFASGKVMKQFHLSCLKDFISFNACLLQYSISISYNYRKTLLFGFIIYRVETS
jgi:hypothetical protein